IENDFERTENECTKNPGHVGFIPVTELMTSHFPDKYQDQDLVDTVKRLGDLTVKVSVSVSRGAKIGSGKVLDITENTQTGACPCSECRNSNKPRKTWWEIVILTSTHVVDDNEDAKNSKCRLFYDNKESSLFNIEGIRVVKFSPNSDISRLICVTCDKDLATRLNLLLDNFTVLYEKCFDKFWNVKNPEKLVVIVSHPHGAPKKVSIGKSIRRKEVCDGQSVLTYSTNTCPGSTGAFLYIL
ncbi:hypothetical protein BgiMline_021792, partial [Biomphalaria glabrata]